MSSENRFKRAEQKDRVAPGGEKEPPIGGTEPVIAKPTNPIEGKIAPKPEGKSYGFYLSAKAAENLERLARQNRCSKSKALDVLLSDLYE